MNPAVPKLQLRDKEIYYEVDLSNGPKLKDFDQDDIKPIFDQAVKMWSDVINSPSFQLRIGHPVTFIPTSDHPNPHIKFSWGEVSYEGGLDYTRTAETLLNPGDSEYRHTPISVVFSNKVEWLEIPKDPNFFEDLYKPIGDLLKKLGVGNDQTDLLSTAVHEMGHVLGLGHDARHPDSIMTSTATTWGAKYVYANAKIPVVDVYALQERYSEYTHPKANRSTSWWDRHDWHQQYDIPIPDDMVLAGLEVMDKKGEGIVNVRLLGRRFTGVRGGSGVRQLQPDLIPITGLTVSDREKQTTVRRPEDKKGWVNDYQVGKDRTFHYHCRPDIKINGLKVVNLNKTAATVVNIQALNSDGSAGGWLTKNETPDSESADWNQDAFYPPVNDRLNWREGDIVHVSFRAYPDNGIVDFKYDYWLDKNKFD